MPKCLQTDPVPFHHPTRGAGQVDAQPMQVILLTTQGDRSPGDVGPDHSYPVMVTSQCLPALSADERPGTVETPGELRHPRHEPLSCGTRCLLGQGGGLVGDGSVHVVTDTGQHGDGGGGDGAGHDLGVEDSQVQFGPAPTNQCDDVHVGTETGEGRCDPICGMLPLNGRVGESDGEPEAGASQLVHEVGVSGGAAARDQANPKRDQRERETGVGGERPVGREPTEHLGAIQGEPRSSGSVRRIR